MTRQNFIQSIALLRQMSNIEMMIIQMVKDKFHSDIFYSAYFLVALSVGREDQTFVSDSVYHVDYI